MTEHETPVWSLELSTATAEATQDLAARIASGLRTGDLLVLSGELGAGKTTFTQGLGAGLGVRPGIISPTFVLVRRHPAMAAGPDLVHVDAYRLKTAGELDDLDLESGLDTAVTVVEWGRGKVEHLSDSRLEISLLRATGNAGAGGSASGGGSPLEEDAPGGAVPETGGPGLDLAALDFEETDQDDPRVVKVSAFGPRWAAAGSSWLAERS